MSPTCTDCGLTANLSAKNLAQMPSESERDFSVRGKAHVAEVLYQGTTLVVPQMTESRLGFSPCGTTESLILPEGAWGFSPTKYARRMTGFSPGPSVVASNPPSFRNPVHRAQIATQPFPDLSPECLLA